MLSTTWFEIHIAASHVQRHRLLPVRFLASSYFFLPPERRLNFRFTQSLAECLNSVCSKLYSPSYTAINTIGSSPSFRGRDSLLIELSSDSCPRGPQFQRRARDGFCSDFVTRHKVCIAFPGCGCMILTSGFPVGPLSVVWQSTDI